jgi:uncharacterized protein (DUF934 family)
MQVIKNDQVIEENWQHVADEEALPDHGDVLVSWQRWLGDREALVGHDGRIGVRVSGDLPVTDLALDLSGIAMIALDFTKMGDGRCFTHARMLRERYRYRGEIRATGYVIRDLLLFMRRCGVDSFELREGPDPKAALAAFTEQTVKYQSAADGALPIYHTR